VAAIASVASVVSLTRDLELFSAFRERDGPLPTSGSSREEEIVSAPSLLGHARAILSFGDVLMRVLYVPAGMTEEEARKHCDLT
jgi:hypothetical protein